MKIKKLRLQLKESEVLAVSEYVLIKFKSDRKVKSDLNKLLSNREDSSILRDKRIYEYLKANDLIIEEKKVLRDELDKSFNTVAQKRLQYKNYSPILYYIERFDEYVPTPWGEGSNYLNSHIYVCEKATGKVVAETWDSCCNPMWRNYLQVRI